jgi:hypothetical protein
MRIFYDLPNPFRALDYESSVQDSQAIDYRSTLYWNPNLITGQTGEGTVTFYTSDLTGKYRVTVEGVNSNGEPVRAVVFVKISE